MMHESKRKEIILRTLELVNLAVTEDRNTLVSRESGEVNPGGAYIDLVMKIVKLDER